MKRKDKHEVAKTRKRWKYDRDGNDKGQKLSLAGAFHIKKREEGNKKLINDYWYDNDVHYDDK
ncbi:hypothetical protein E2C01_099486 [Portunus trituberculatus]|uniref:Uncharacterized protein n=1 Tax=Portunus trituberculatus TaxID=210409 RepID=A0A5B7K3Y7_PORTR|nr:hypothetical protein [Portunus trituberculatus]